MDIINIGQNVRLNPNFFHAMGMVLESNDTTAEELSRQVITSGPGADAVDIPNITSKVLPEPTKLVIPPRPVVDISGINANVNVFEQQVDSLSTRLNSLDWSNPDAMLQWKSDASSIEAGLRQIHSEAVRLNDGTNSAIVAMVSLIDDLVSHLNTLIGAYAEHEFNTINYNVGILAQSGVPAGEIAAEMIHTYGDNTTTAELANQVITSGSEDDIAAIINITPAVLIEQTQPTDNLMDNTVVGPIFIDDSENTSGDATTNTDAQAGLVSGGGGGLSFSSGEKVATSDGGFVQMPSGIEITGYIYPYAFLAITLAGGALGFFVGKKYAQPTLGILALVAAGLMGGSAVGMKVKPPVKKIG